MRVTIYNFTPINFQQELTELKQNSSVAFIVISLKILCRAAKYLVYQQLSNATQYKNRFIQT